MSTSRTVRKYADVLNAPLNWMAQMFWGFVEVLIQEFFACAFFSIL